MSRAATQARERPLILVVDDVPDGLDLCSLLLQSRGFDTATAVDGVEAVEQTRELLPDVVLMDISLPRMSGLEATRMLKDEPPTRDIPIIAVTAHALESARREALEAGCADVVTKPYVSDDIVQAIHQQLDARRASDEAPTPPKDQQGDEP